MRAARFLPCLAVLPIAAVLLAGCMSATPAGPPAATDVKATATATPTPTPTDVGPVYVPIRADQSKPFGAYFIFAPAKGDSLKYSRDVIVEVDDAGAYTPASGSYVKGAKAKRYARYEIVVTNNTKLTLDPSTFQVAAQDGDTEAGRLIDDKTPSSPLTPIRPGRTLKWAVVFGNDAGAPAVTVTPSIPDATGAYDAVLLTPGTWTP